MAQLVIIRGNSGFGETSLAKNYKIILVVGRL